jgi:hypothetical protein
MPRVGARVAEPAYPARGIGEHKENINAWRAENIIPECPIAGIISNAGVPPASD